MFRTQDLIAFPLLISAHIRLPLSRQVEVSPEFSSLDLLHLCPATSGPFGVKLEAAFSLAKDALLDNTARREKERRFYETIAPPTPDTVAYDENLFIATIERIVVSAMNGEKYTLEYYFKNGDKIKITKTTK